ncbi:Multicopper oxidasetype 2 [Penicillium lividum]|nr:Multicopper oxidasetype 2 [Penicillium lividum]
MAKFNFLLLASWAAKLVAAKDVYLDWNVTWVNASPDGFERPVIGINGHWPCPQIDVNLGDRLIVDVYNGLGNESTGIHWHGMRQYGTGVMDGSTSVTQCGIPPGQHMQYHFDINQTGTYWYHSHTMGQYPDGFRGPLIVHDPKPPFQYDDEFTLTLSDWYHDQMPDLLAKYESQANEAATHGEEPLPNSALINDSTKTKIKVEPNKTYLVHIVCVGNWPGHVWVFDDHEMTVVEVDGVYTEPYHVGDKNVRIATGQRMSVLIHTKSDTSKNFAIWDSMDVNMMFIYENRSIPANFNPNATAWLVYDESKPLPPAPVINKLDFVDDVAFLPADHEPLLEPVNHQIILDASNATINGMPRFTINNQTYIAQDVPTLYTANTVGAEFASNPAVYGQVNPFVVKHNEVVEIVINNHHENLHPWHLHGHQFQVLQRSLEGYFTGQYFKNVSKTPIRRDTIMLNPHGHAVLRFRADNPGVWLLHCHVEWHVSAGLMATIIEAPETFPQSENPPPQSHYNVCAAYPNPISGNAAGKNGLDLSGANTNVPTEEHGALYPEHVKAAKTTNTANVAPAVPAAAQATTANGSGAHQPAPQVLAPEAPKAAAQAPKPASKPAPEPAPKPVAQAPKPAAEAPKPVPQAPKPVAQAPKPAAEAPKPVAQAPKPVAQAPKPVAQAPKPVAQAPKPVAQAPKPVAQAPKPVTQAPKPVAQAPKPVAQAPKPVAQAPKPVAQAPKPAPQAPKPAAQAPKPVAQAPKPAPQAPKPVAQAPKPVTQAPKPVPQAPKPAPQAPKPVAQDPKPAPHAQAHHAPAPAPEYAAPHHVEAVPAYPSYYEPIYAHEHDSEGPWPQPHMDESYGQIGDGYDGRPPTYGHTEDTKGPWPNSHNDMSQAQVPNGPDGKPIIAHTDDAKGPWPAAQQNNAYVEEGGHIIRPAPDSGSNDLPKDFQYWGQYEQ